MKIKVSVIVPVYNCKDYLERCVLSILRQSFLPNEVILIDDGSSDGSGELCDYYSKKYDFVKVFHYTNSGVAEARNRGIEVSNGNYITFIDSDDYIEVDMIKKMVEVVQENSDVDVVCVPILVEDKNTITARKYNVRYDQRNAFLQNREVFGRLFRRQVIQNIRFLDYAIGEDFRFLVDVLKNKKTLQFAFIGEGAYHYVTREGSAVHDIYNYKKYLMSVQNEVESYHILKELNVDVLPIRLIENAVYNFLKRYSRIPFGEKIKNFPSYILFRKYSFQYCNIIFSYRGGIKRWMFHVLLVFTPIILVFFCKAE